MMVNTLDIPLCVFIFLFLLINKETTLRLMFELMFWAAIWGPHLIVVPTSVMLNWEMELKKWCPAFKILTYYGTLKERKLKRQVQVLSF